LLYSLVLFSNFWAAVSALALLSCSTVHVAALFLYWFIEQINDDDDDEDDKNSLKFEYLGRFFSSPVKFPKPVYCSCIRDRRYDLQTVFCDYPEKDTAQFSKTDDHVTLEKHRNKQVVAGEQTDANLGKNKQDELRKLYSNRVSTYPV